MDTINRAAASSVWLWSQQTSPRYSSHSPTPALPCSAACSPPQRQTQRRTKTRELHSVAICRLSHLSSRPPSPRLHVRPLCHCPCPSAYRHCRLALGRQARRVEGKADDDRVLADDGLAMHFLRIKDPELFRGRLLTVHLSPKLTRCAMILSLGRRTGGALSASQQRATSARRSCAHARADERGRQGPALVVGTSTKASASRHEQTNIEITDTQAVCRSPRCVCRTAHSTVLPVGLWPPKDCRVLMATSIPWRSIHR